jgi:hypothetical protein
MLKMVDGTGIIGVDMVCPLGVSAPQPPNYDRVELEGTGMLVLPNSLDAPLERLELGGKTEQVQTSGKQLFDAKNAELNKWVGSTGIIATVGRNCIFRLNVKPNTVYQVNILSASSTFSFSQFSKENVFLERTVFSKGTKSFKCTTTEDVDYAYFLIGDTVDNINGIINDVMLYEGEEYKNYEPYTGGKPSPSQEYPQEIKNVGKWNEGTQKYEVEISISGRNIFDFSTCEEGKVFEGSGNIISTTNGVLTDFIPCFPNSQYSRSRTGSTVVAFYDCDKNKIGFEIVGNTTFVTPEKCRYFRFSALKTLVDYTKIVACPGQTVMDYEPYREPKFSIITADQPLREIGKLKDVLSEDGILRNIKKVVLDGSENWYKYENAAFVTMNCYGYKIDDLKVHNYNQTSLCNVSKWARFPQDVESQTAHGGYIYFTVPKETYPDLESFKGWLAKNTPILEYQLKEPVLEELSEEDKTSIRALKTYYPTTVITVDGGEVDPDIKVTYRKEI